MLIGPLKLNELNFFAYTVYGYRVYQKKALLNIHEY